MIILSIFNFILTNKTNIMFSKTNLISTVAGTLWTYFGGYFLWEVVGPYLFSSNEESNPEHVHLIIACLITAFAFSGSSSQSAPLVMAAQ